MDTLNEIRVEHQTIEIITRNNNNNVVPNIIYRYKFTENFINMMNEKTLKKLGKYGLKKTKILLILKPQD